MRAGPPEETQTAERPPAAATARPAGGEAPAAASGPSRAVAALAFLRRHWLFVGLVVAGIALRAVTLAAYRPAIFGITDSYWYLDESESLSPAELRPFGYPVFLRILPLGWGLEVATVVQHLLGVLVAVLLYAALLRLGVRSWLAALATVPALLDTYVLNLEQQILAETAFHLLLVGACAILLWRRPLTVPFAAAAGLFLMAAALTRSVGVVLILPALVAAFLLAAPGRRLAVGGAILVSFLVPLGAYAVWFHSHHDVYGLSRTSGRFLYGRIAPIVDCTQFAVPARERVLCPDEPLGQRLDDYSYMWVASSPVHDVVPPPGQTQDEVAGTFARRAIRNQPLDYAELVLRDLLRGYTAPTRETTSSGYRIDPWEFQRGFPTYYLGLTCPPSPGAARSYVVGCERRASRTAEVLAAYGHEEGRANEDLTSFLRSYQRVGYLPSPLLLAGLVLSILAVAGIGRARRSGLRSATFLFAGLALALALASAIASSFSWRYQLPQLFLLPAAAALAVTALAGRSDRLSGTQSSAA